MMFSGNPVYAIAPILGLAANVVMQVATLYLIRWWSQRDTGMIASLVMGFVFGLIVVTLQSVMAVEAVDLTIGERMGMVMFNSATYSAFAFCYFTFVNLNIASLRIRILHELQNTPDGTLTIDEVLTKYNPKHIVEARLKRLVQGGQLIENARRYFNGKRQFLILAKTFDFLKILVLGRNMK